MEVRVDTRREARPGQRPREVAGAVRRRHGAQGRSVDLDPGGGVELGPRRVGREVGRPGRARRAVHVAEVGACARDTAVRVPPAAAEERRGDAALRQPGALAPDPLARIAAGRPGVRRAREVRVVAERAARRGLVRTTEPRLVVVLAGVRVRRPHQRRDREAAGAPLLQRRERRPDAVVERPFDVTGDHGVPFRSRGRHRATHTTPRGRPRRGGRRAAASPRPRDRAGRHPRGVRREERHVRADARRERDVRLPARGLVRLHAAALRMVPRRPLLAARPLVGRRRARPGRPRRRHGAARARDRPAPRLGPDRRHRRPRRDAAPVPRLARRARQPGDRRPGPPRRARPPHAPRPRPALDLARDRRGRRRRARRPVERAPAAPASRRRAVRRVARAAGAASGRRRPPRRRRIGRRRRRPGSRGTRR